MKEDEKKDFSQNCPCVRKKCSRFGKCEECREHHLKHKKYRVPYCERGK